MHENLHQNVNENVFIHIFIQIFLSFYEWQLKQYVISMVFNQFKIEVQFFLTASSFPNFDGPNAFFPNSAGPWPWLQKGRKIPAITK